MSQKMSGSEKLKATCQTMANLSPEEISQIAGGASGYGSFLDHWMIKGIPNPIDFYRGIDINRLDLNQVNLPNINISNGF